MYMLFMTRKGCLLNIMFVYGIQMYTDINLACVAVCMYNVSMYHNLYIWYRYTCTCTGIKFTCVTVVYM